MSKLSRRIVGFTAAAILLGAAALYLTGRGFSGRFSEGAHVSRVDWLPKEATDVTFQRMDGGLFPRYWFECTISHENLVKLAALSEWRLEERSQVYLSSRYVLRLAPLNLAGATAQDTLPSALCFETIQVNGGGIFVAYHRESERLFVRYSSH